MSNSLRPHYTVYNLWNSPDQNTESGHPFPSLGDLAKPRIEPSSPVLQADSLPAEHKRSPRILERVAFPSPADLPDPGIELGSPLLQVDSLPTELSIYMYSSPIWGFPGGSDGKESTCNAENPGLIPGSGRSPGEGNGNPPLYSCLENPIDRRTGYSPWGRKESDVMNDSDFHFSYGPGASPTPAPQSGAEPGPQ